MNNIKPIIWLLADDRAGNTNQSLGVAEALDLDFEIKNISYTQTARLTNLVRGASLMGVSRDSKTQFHAPWPDMVIAAGRKTAPICRFIKHSSNKPTALVHLMWPDSVIDDFDLIAIPKHDISKNAPNIIHTIGAPNRISSSLLAQESNTWKKTFSDISAPKIAVLIGGNSKHGTFDSQRANKMARLASALIDKKNGTFLISSSRRTSHKALDFFINGLSAPYYLHDYSSGGANPYIGFLGLSDAIIVSGDSISMCSEACSSGKPVYIYADNNLISKKHRHFHETLYELGVAKPLAGKLEPWSYKPLNDSHELAKYIKQHFVK